MDLKTRSLFTLKSLLQVAQRNGFAVGAFSPRYTPMKRTTDAALRTIPPEALDLGSQAVQRVVEEKIVHFLTSNNHASDYPL